MTITPQYTVWCDAKAWTGRGCEHWIGQEETIEAARKLAKAAGWRRRQGRDLCPFCWAHRADDPADTDSTTGESDGALLHDATPDSEGDWIVGGAADTNGEGFVYVRDLLRESGSDSSEGMTGPTPAKASAHRRGAGA